jgi:hypothetical protein
MNAPRISTERAAEITAKLANRAPMDWPLSAQDEDDLLLMGLDLLDERREKPECSR